MQNTGQSPGYCEISKRLTKGIFLVFSFLAGFIMTENTHAQTVTDIIEPISPLKEWRVVVQAGTGLLLSEVPDKYLGNINNVNLPVFQPGLAGGLSMKKMITPHLETGYRFDYLRIRGMASLPAPREGDSRTKVITQGFGHNFTMGYVFRESLENNPKANFSIAYKIGGLSLKNKFDDPHMSDNSKTVFLSNVAVITGIITEFSFHRKDDLNIIVAAEYNRSSDTAGDIFKIYKLFYFSPNTVNNYITVTLGLSYRFALSKNKPGRKEKESPWYRKKQ
jgi:hypothetical protein